MSFVFSLALSCTCPFPLSLRLCISLSLILRTQISPCVLFVIHFSCFVFPFLSLLPSVLFISYDRLRPLSYPQTDVFLVCMSVISPASFENVKSKWWPEITHHCPNAPFILVGLKSDMRESTQRGLQLIPKEAAEKLAREIGAKAYRECSALTQDGLKAVFDTAIRVALEGKKPRPRPNRCIIL